MRYRGRDLLILLESYKVRLLKVSKELIDNETNDTMRYDNLFNVTFMFS